MNRRDYLDFAIAHKCYYKRVWIISAFAVTRESDRQREKVFVGKLIREPFAFFYLDENLEKQPIEDKLDMSAALFRASDRVTITKAKLPFLQEDSIECSIGRLMLNLWVVDAPFAGRMPFINKPFEPKHVEEIIAPVLQSTLKEGESKEAGKYYVDELRKFSKAVGFVETLSSMFVNSVTRAAMLPAPGRKEFKKEVLKKYEGKLRDPIQMAHFQKELADFDNAYLKENDAAYGIFTAGKVVNARNKTFMTQGGESNEFIDQLDTTPIIKSLDEGIDMSPEQFTASANTIRYGSYSRGAETVNGGVAAKALQNALDTSRIVDGDCGTKLGIYHHYTDKNYHEAVGRTLFINSKPTLIKTKEEAKSLVGNVFLVRSPQYCSLSDGLSDAKTCRVCAGEQLAIYPTGQIIPAMEVSSGIMTDSLKKMHSTAIKTKTMNLEAVIS